MDTVSESENSARFKAILFLGLDTLERYCEWSETLVARSRLALPSGHTENAQDVAIGPQRALAAESDDAGPHEKPVQAETSPNRQTESEGE